MHWRLTPSSPSCFRLIPARRCASARRPRPSPSTANSIDCSASTRKSCRRRRSGAKQALANSDEKIAKSLIYRTCDPQTVEVGLTPDPNPGSSQSQKTTSLLSTDRSSTVRLVMQTARHLTIRRLSQVAWGAGTRRRSHNPGKVIGSQSRRALRQDWSTEPRGLRCAEVTSCSEHQRTWLHIRGSCSRRLPEQGSRETIPADGSSI